MTGRAVAGWVLLGAFAVALAMLSDPRPPVPALPQGPATFTSPRTCLPCHAAVVAEWEASMHAQAFVDPQVRAPEQANNFRKTECLPCHAPAPIFAHGIETDSRALARVERRADGVDCLACHQVQGGMAATRQIPGAPCRPVYRAELSTHRICAACHDQHDTHQEWLASPAADDGVDCLDCHMPRVARRNPEAGAPRAGRSHRFPGGRDRHFALAGLSIEPSLQDEGGTLVVTVHNRFAGHNLPTDSRNRALDLVVTLRDARGAALPPAPGETRPPGQRRGTARLRFRNPYRSSGRPSTQIAAGAKSTLRVALPREARRATIDLLYKLQPFVEDEQAHWSHRVELDLNRP